MSNRETEIARKVVGYLDHGTADLKAGIAYRLQQARAQALARLTEPEPQFRTQTVPALAGMPGSLGRSTPPRSAWRWWIATALVVAAVGFGWQQWRAFQQTKEFEEIDAQILASDLPIDAYVDRGFQNWLKASFDY